MASPEVLDLAALLAPIRADAPCGENLRNDPSPTSPYYQVKEARDQARTQERALQLSEDPSSAPAPDWQPVLELAPRLLAERAKDLQVAAWLIEALARERGFAGLRDGFRLARGLVDGFWDGLYPTPDEEGVSTRVAPLTGLNGDESEGTLIVPIGMIQVLEDGEGRKLGAWHFKLARELAAIQDPELRARRLENGAPTLEGFRSAAAAADRAALFTRLDDVDQALNELEALGKSLEARCQRDAPPTSSVRQALSEVRDCLRFLTKDLPRPVEVGAAPGDAQAQDSKESRAQSSAPAAEPGVVRSRQDALDAVRKARDYWRQTEPHSPLPYLLDQALRWGQTPLHLLVPELIPDAAALAAFQLRTGMVTPAGQETNQSN
jgi:type VI secretion system protein ImpA